MSRLACHVVERCTRLFGSSRAGIAAGAVVAASLLSAGAALAASPPVTAYAEPHPTPTPDAAAKAFVEHVAPSLRGVSAAELARGVVLPPRVDGSQHPAVQATSPRPRSDAAPAPSVRRAQQQAQGQAQARASRPVERRMLERAGVGSGGNGFELRWGIVVVAGLALAALGGWIWISRRSRSRGGA